MEGPLRAEAYNERYPVFGPGREEFSLALQEQVAHMQEQLARKAIEHVEVLKDFQLETRHATDLHRRVNNLSNQLRVAEQVANTDALTDVANLRGLNYWGEHVYEEKMFLNEGQCTFALMTFDISRFKEVNEVLGHDVGDVLLRRFAVVLKSSLRTSYDAVERDERRVGFVQDHVVGRLGGDEFGVCLDLNHSDITTVEPVVERIAQRIHTGFMETTTEERGMIKDRKQFNESLRGLLELHYHVTFNEPNEPFADFLERAKAAINSSKAKIKSQEA
jgi:diguanylate cyclase (GGDEF)-like protein